MRAEFGAGGRAFLAAVGLTLGLLTAESRRHLLPSRLAEFVLPVRLPQQKFTPQFLPTLVQAKTEARASHGRVFLDGQAGVDIGPPLHFRS